MSIVTATVFMNNKNQAIRIPKIAELPETTKNVNIIIQKIYYHPCQSGLE